MKTPVRAILVNFARNVSGIENRKRRLLMAFVVAAVVAAIIVAVGGRPRAKPAKENMPAELPGDQAKPELDSHGGTLPEEADDALPDSSAQEGADKPPFWLFSQERRLLGKDAAQFAEQDLSRGLGPFSRRSQPVPDSRISMSIALKNSNMVEGDLLELEVELRNNSTDSLSVNTGQPHNGFQARIFDSTGKFYWGQITRIEGSFGHIEKKHFVEIKPDDSIRLSLPVRAIADFDSPRSHGWQRVFAGSFILSLEFSSRSTSWYDTETRKRVVIPNSWTGFAVSNCVQYEVKPKE